METLSLVPATALGYLTFRAAMHPKSRVWKKLMHRPVKAKRVQVFPSIRVRIAGRTIHFHHWFNLSILLAISNFENSGLLANMFAKGILLGGVIQGLSLPKEHRKIIYREPHPSDYPTL